MMIEWTKRRLKIVQRNLTWFEGIVVAGIFSLAASILPTLLKSSFEKSRFEVSEDLEPRLVYTFIAMFTLLCWRALYVLFWEPPRNQLPLGAGNSELRFSAKFINSPKAIGEVNALVSGAFSQSTLPDETVSEILLKNSRATLGLYQSAKEGKSFSRTEELVGCASCWPVTNEVYRGMRANTMEEADIRPEHVFYDGEMQMAEYFYVPIVLVRDFDNAIGRLQAAALLVEFARHIRTLSTLHTVRPIKLFCIGFTNSGMALARRLGFRRTANVEQYAKENRHFYELDLTPDAIAALELAEKRMLMKAIGLTAGS